MNKALTIVIVAVVAVAAIGAAVVLMNNGNGDKTVDDTNGIQMEFVGNIASYMFSVYLGQKGSSDRTLLDDGGTFDVPADDPIIILVAKNPSADISLDGNKIVIPLSDETVKANIGFQYATVDAPVLIDSTSAYYPFTPNADKINLGVFASS
jgi:hypothetical protein